MSPGQLSPDDERVHQGPYGQEEDFDAVLRRIARKIEVSSLRADEKGDVLAGLAQLGSLHTATEAQNERVSC